MGLSKLFFTFLMVVSSFSPNAEASGSVSSGGAHPKRRSDADVVAAGGGEVTNDIATPSGAQVDEFGVPQPPKSTVTFCETTSNPPKCDAQCKSLYGTCVTGCCRPAQVPGVGDGNACFCCLGISSTFSTWGSNLAWQCSQIPTQVGTNPKPCPCNCIKIGAATANCPASSRHLEEEEMRAANVTAIFDTVEFGFDAYSKDDAHFIS